MPKPTDTPLLLDTHVWIWALEGGAGRLSRNTLKAIGGAATAGRLWASAISVWEIGTLLHKGRIALAIELDRWVAESRAPPGIHLQPVTAEIAMDSSALPGSPVGDPADRIIVATARALRATLVTCDASLLAYAAGGHVRGWDACIN